METADPAVVGKNGEVKRVRLRGNMTVSIVHRKLTDPIRFGVNISFVQVPLPLHCPDLASRVSAIRSHIDWLKVTAMPWIIFHLQRIMFLVAGSRLFSWKLEDAGGKSTYTISNVPGPREKVALPQLCSIKTQNVEAFGSLGIFGTVVCPSWGHKR
jgi:hypothetical protein